MHQPFQELGGELKSIREKLSESIAEVSGAVEIDTEVLERIETGQECPSEDVLMLLISHFNIPDDDALELWELAGYDESHNKYKPQSDDIQNRQVVMMMALDTRILYSDSAHINVNKNGVVLNFLQNSGTPKQQVPVARLGMSYAQAQTFLSTLQQTLAQAAAAKQPKGLPAPKQSQDKNSKAS